MESSDKRIEALAAEALKRDPEERNAFLDAECAGRPSLPRVSRHAPGGQYTEQESSVQHHCGHTR